MIDWLGTHIMLQFILFCMIVISTVNVVVLVLREVVRRLSLCLDQKIQQNVVLNNKVTEALLALNEKYTILHKIKHYNSIICQKHQTTNEQIRLRLLIDPKDQQSAIVSITKILKQLHNLIKMNLITKFPIISCINQLKLYWTEIQQQMYKMYLHNKYLQIRTDLQLFNIIQAINTLKNINKKLHEIQSAIMKQYGQVNCKINDILDLNKLFERINICKAQGSLMKILGLLRQQEFIEIFKENSQIVDQQRYLLNIRQCLKILDELVCQQQPLNSKFQQKLDISTNDLHINQENTIKQFTKNSQKQSNNIRSVASQFKNIAQKQQFCKQLDLLMLKGRSQKRISRIYDIEENLSSSQQSYSSA